MRIPGLVVALAATILLSPCWANAQSSSLAAVRLQNVDEDSVQAATLLSFGAVSVTYGIEEAATGIGGDRARWFGLNTALWGAINAVIATNWYTGTLRERRSIAADGELTGDALATRHHEALEHSRTQSRAFLINALLDVAYVGGGVALFAATDHNQDFWPAAGLAALSQGAFLLVFDLVGWGLANARTHRLERTP